MTHREKIRSIAERCWVDEETSTNRDEDIRIIERAILSAIEAVLGAEPSEGIIDAGFGATVWPDLSKGTKLEQDAVRRNMRKEFDAMSAELIKELKC